MKRREPTMDVNDLSKRSAHDLARPQKELTIGSLEEALLRTFPARYAAEWDRTGLLVGERGLPVRKVAVALDPTVAAIEEAAAVGANVLLTHHPAFLDPPTEFSPEPSAALSSGACVWAAIRDRVALMNFHTALDVSPRGQRVLPQMLGLRPLDAVVEPAGETAAKANPAIGYGTLCAVPKTDDAPRTVGRLAARCTAMFGRAPRVWGEFDAPIETVVTAGGAAGHLGHAALGLRDRKVDCLVTGEVRYHAALELAAAGMAVIELGHDVSELPLTAVLAEAAAHAGVPDTAIFMMDQRHNWSYPEAIRL